MVRAVDDMHVIGRKKFREHSLSFEQPIATSGQNPGWRQLFDVRAEKRPDLFVDLTLAQRAVRGPYDWTARPFDLPE